MRRLAILGGLLLTSGVLAANPEPKLAVHEWGTFTALQDEKGQAIGAINADVVPVPDFVHTLPIKAEIDLSKGFPIHTSHRDITMRLETPVIYFHLRDGQQAMTVDVRESFRGGWLTQFYPDASSDAPGADSKDSHITANTIGTLAWKNLHIGGAHELVKTNSPLWLAPRDVNASEVVNNKGEAERFLFDRGVGHIDAPVAISRNGRQLEIRSRIDPSLSAEGRPLHVPAWWLLNVRKDGSRAFRAIGGADLTADGNKIIATADADFAEKDYSPDLKPLLDSMRTQLVEAGLNRDEADALLNTWRAAYFNATGQRVLFLAPRPWTDHYLPLEISKPADVTRVMVARVELVTPKLRELAIRATGDPPDPTAAEELTKWRFGIPLIQAEWQQRATAKPQPQTTAG